jgi:hypothetical protein
MNESRADPQAYDEDARRRLRALSFDLAGLADPLAFRQIRTKRPSPALFVCKKRAADTPPRHSSSVNRSPYLLAGQHRWPH